jgi:hypothetical protein
MSAVLELLAFLAVTFKLQFDLQTHKPRTVSTLAVFVVALLAWNLSGLSASSV